MHTRTHTYKDKVIPSPSVHAANRYSAGQSLQCNAVSHRRWHGQHYAQRGIRVTNGIFTSLTATIRHRAFQPRQPTTSRPVTTSADPLALHLREGRERISDNKGSKNGYQKVTCFP